MLTAAFAAIAAFEVVFFGEDNESGVVEIEIFRV
jgi:hypothetical protein